MRLEPKRDKKSEIPEMRRASLQRKESDPNAPAAAIGRSRDPNDLGLNASRHIELERPIADRPRTAMNPY